MLKRGICNLAEHRQAIVVVVFGKLIFETCAQPTEQGIPIDRANSRLRPLDRDLTCLTLFDLLEIFLELMTDGLRCFVSLKLVFARSDSGALRQAAGLHHEGSVDRLTDGMYICQELKENGEPCELEFKSQIALSSI